MYKILVVDDEIKIRELIKKYADFEGYETDMASNGFIAVEKCKENDYDVVIMDIMMPDLDGFSATKKIREFSDVPIIMLSAKNEEYDRVHGFELGVDDYVVKPFFGKELMMRIGAIAQRRNNKEQKNNVFVYEDFSMNFSARVVKIKDEKINLSPKEYELLSYLVTNQNIALSREKILINVWNYDYDGDDRTLDTHIKLLRKSLREYGKLIVTVRGMGYRFEVL